ncbi:fructose-bisphosphate aldolase [Pseudonocardia sp. HH130630-07]|nr:fructose-bisphosphate aldolase [Pseudonocardia sp. HH130630-07]
MLASARDRGTAVGAFNVIGVEHAEAMVAGAETAGLPVILQLSENCVRYHGAPGPMIAALLAMARAATVPVVVHLDHVESGSLVTAGLEAGVRSLMFDASTLPHEENVARTREVVRQCRAYGARVEAELGEIGGKDGVHAPGARTDPGEAVRFVAGTGVDALAVAVGSSHAMRTRTARLDLELVGRLRAAVPVPLVLHGSSGVPDEDLLRAAHAGLSKINLATHLNGVFTGALREVLDRDPGLTDPRRYLAPARDALATEVTRLLALLSTEKSR